MFIKELKNLLLYKDLFLVLVWREFSVRYKQAVFGVLWAIIPPISLMCLFTFIFSIVVPVKAHSYPQPLFYFSGILPWSFFASALNHAIPSLVSHYNLVRKIYFPRAILPLTRIVVAVADFCIAAIIFIALLLFYQIPLSWAALWFFPLFFLLVVFASAVSLVLSALNVYYRDVGLATSFLIQLWFFVTPVFYSTTEITSSLKWILFLNPLTFIIENMRRCLLEGAPVCWASYLTMLAGILGLLVVSYQFFKVTERKFADVI